MYPSTDIIFIIIAPVYNNFKAPPNITLIFHTAAVIPNTIALTSKNIQTETYVQITTCINKDQILTENLIYSIFDPQLRFENLFLIAVVSYPTQCEPDQIWFN